MDVYDAAEESNNFDNEDNEQEERETRSQAPAVEIDYERLARQIVAEQGGGQQHQPTARERNALQEAISELAKDGVPEKAIRNILKLYSAAAEEDRQRSTVQQMQLSEKQYNDHLWALAEDALEAFADHIPAYDVVMPGLAKKMADVFWHDKEFAEAKAIINQRKVPSMRWYKLAANKVVNTYMKQAGLSKKDGAPQEIRSSRPEATNAGGTYSSAANADDFKKGLDSDGRKQFNALLNALDGNEKEAIATFKESMRAAKGR